MPTSQWESVKVTLYEENVGRTSTTGALSNATAVRILPPVAILWACSGMNTPFIPGHTSAQWLPFPPLPGKLDWAALKTT